MRCSIEVGWELIWIFGSYSGFWSRGVFQPVVSRWEGLTPTFPHDYKILPRQYLIGLVTHQDFINFTSSHSYFFDNWDNQGNIYLVVFPLKIFIWSPSVPRPPQFNKSVPHERATPFQPPKCLSFMCGTGGVLMLNWGVIGVELTRVFNWLVFGVELRGFWF